MTWPQTPQRSGRKSGSSFQDTTLDEYLTAQENLRFHAELYGVPRSTVGPRLAEVMEMVGLWDDLARRCSHLGGNSGPYFLRMAGKDSFLLTGDVARALQHWGVADRPPKGKGDRRRVQAAFNAWAAETGRPLCQLSMILALSAV